MPGHRKARERSGQGGHLEALMGGASFALVWPPGCCPLCSAVAGKNQMIKPGWEPRPPRSAVRPALCYSSGSRVTDLGSRIIGSRVIAPASWGKGGGAGVLSRPPFPGQS